MGSGGRSGRGSAGCVSESGQQPGTESLQGPAEFVFAGQQESQAASQKRENHPSGHTGAPFERCWRGGMWWSVPAGEFGHINSQPCVVAEIEELNFTKEGSGDGRGCESPRVRIATEFEAGDEEADADAGLGAGDQRELLEDVWSTSSRHRDSDQAALCLGRLDLPSHAGNRGLRGGRLPLFLGAEPRDGLFVGRDVGGTGPDVSRVDDLFELQAGRVVEDCVGRIGTGWS
jgi:hypothetical protein